MDDRPGYAPRSPDLTGITPAEPPASTSGELFSHSFLPLSAQHQQPQLPSHHPHTSSHRHQHEPFALPRVDSFGWNQPGPHGFAEHHPQAHLAPPGSGPVFEPGLLRSNAAMNPSHTQPYGQPMGSFNPSEQQMPAMAAPKQEEHKPAPGELEGITVRTKFPVARIKRIVQADEDVGKVAQVTPVVVSKALELFMISLALKSAAEARSRSSKRITSVHLKHAVAKDEQFDFLSDIVTKISDQPGGHKERKPKDDSDDSDIDTGAAGKKRRNAGRKRKGDDS